MKGFILVGVLCFATTVLGINLQPEIFEQLIGGPCLNPQRFQQQDFQPLARSMESFIGIVEKLENKHPNWNLYTVSRNLIKRFAFDGISYRKITNSWYPVQQAHYKERTEIIDALVDLTISDQEKFNEDDLTSDEKCSMFYMLGHLVNRTYLEGDELFTGSVQHVEESDTNKKDQWTRNPREQGVVSLYGNKEHAVAIGKVLIAIIASANTQKPTLNDLFRAELEKNKDIKYPFADKRIDPLVGVTIADVAAHAVIAGGETSNLVGRGGEWNSTFCSTEYKLHDAHSGATVALIRGAIDGFKIANRLREFTNAMDLSLSKLLRMYYDPRGIPANQGNVATNYCNRIYTDVIDEQTIIESTEAYYHIYFLKHTGGATFDNDGDSKARKGLSEVSRITGTAVNDGKCHQSREYQCETIADVFVVVDDSERGTTGMDFQQQVIGRLASSLDIGLKAGSLSVFFNSRQSGANLQPVNRLTLNATNSAYATCALTWTNNFNIPQAVDEESLLLGLNSTLQDFELKTSEYPHSSAKSVVIFKYGDRKTSDENRLRNAANVLRYGHRDTKVIAVGNQQKDLEFLASDLEDVLTSRGNAESLGDELYNKICEVPSVLQHDECWNHRNRNEEDNKFTGYITPEATQYWAMYPQYFLKSYTVNFKFTAEYGEITVCHSRHDPTPKEGGTNTYLECRTTQQTEREIYFKMVDPCKSYDVNNCPPAYFSVKGIRKTDGQPSNRCTDQYCRRTDQIKFQVSHEGVSCNSSIMLKASPFVLLAILASVFNYLFKH